MKKAQKVLAVVLLLFLTLSLGACGKDDIIGVWQVKIDLTDKINPNIIAAFDSTGILSKLDMQTPALTDYLTDFSLTRVYVFNEDGSFSCTVDEESLGTSLDGLKSSLSDFTEDAMFSVLAYTCVQMGLAESVSTTEELEAVMGVSMDEAMTEGLGMSLEDFINGLLDAALSAETIKDELNTQGKYEAKDGKLHMSQGPDEPVFPEIYDVYTVEGNTMTIKAGPAGITSGAAQYYPLTLEKIA